mgnify:FL=1
MDEIFKQFENWFLSKKDTWKRNDIVVDEAGLSEFGHQYWIKLHSNNGLGNIVLYESNGYYWVDFESGNYDCGIIFQRAGIEFYSINELDIYEKDFIKHIT